MTSHKPIKSVDEFGNTTWYILVPAPGGRRHQVKNLHRDDGPAVITPSGTEKWYQYDRLHRENDLPAIVSINHESWYYKGKLHRLTGPAIIHSDGEKLFYLDDINYSEKEYHRRVKMYLFK